MRVLPFVMMLSGATFLGAVSAAAGTFTVIGSVYGGAQIGAVRGDTLYGTTPYQSDGILFSMSLAGHYTALHNFSGSTDGSQPNARLVLDGAGNIFGTAPLGGAYSGGTLWEFTAAGTMRTPHAFGNDGDGAVPMQGPSLGPSGAIFGTTGEGAIGGSGNIFNLTSGTYDVMYEFMSQGDGHCPFSGLTIGPDGTLYGTTVGVGFGGNPTGSVWKFSTAGVLTTLYVFQDGADGEWPDQAPVIDKHGNLFGTTHVQNGSDFAGAVWEITSGGTFVLLHAMNSATDGAVPNSPLLLGGHGTLYGTTSNGGTGGLGTLFSITKAGTFTVEHSFSGGDDGGNPSGNLVRGAHDMIYGGTNYGPVFSFKP